MLNNLYAMQDTKTRFYMQPIVAVNDYDAKRKFTQVVEGTRSFSRFPEDYRIFMIGTYDDSTGSIAGIIPSTLLCEVSELINKEKKEDED